MGMTCKTCQRSDLQEINGLLLQGIPLRTIANQIGDPDHLRLLRHKENCIQSLFADKRDETRAGLLKDVDDLKAEILECKEDFADNATARVQLIARRREAIDLEAKLTGAYVQAATNPVDIEIAKSVKAIVDKITESATLKGRTVKDEYEIWKHYSDNVPAEIRAQLVSVLEQ